MADIKACERSLKVTDVEEQLRQEESYCYNCGHWAKGNDYCEGCGTYGNIQDMERFLESVGTEKNRKKTKR